MQIDRVETYPLFYRLTQPYGDANGYKHYRTCYLFRVITKSGIEGWGECIDWLPTLEKGFQERIIPFLIGKNATNRTQLVKTIKKWHQRAAAGVSMALTEIVAKNAGLSVCDLWGGKWRDSIPVYASFQSYTPQNQWVKHSLGMVEQAISSGYNKIKVKIGGRTLKEDQDHVKALLEMLAADTQIAIDGNESYDLSATRRWCDLLAPWPNIMWLEEPMPLDHVSEYKLLRASMRIPIAGGENMKSATQFLPLLKAGAMDIIQPDVMHVDGIDEYRNSLQLARYFGLQASPHAYDGILSRLYAVFAQSCLPPWSKMEGEEIEPVEWDVMENPFTELISIQPLASRVTIPSDIGIGVELDIERMEAHRWDGGAYV